MRRAVLEGPGRFRVVEADGPAPGPGEVLLRVRAVGICGSDLHIFREARIGGDPVGESFTPGHECMAVVEAAGEGVAAELVGRRVAVDPAIPCGSCPACRAGWGNLCPAVRFLGAPPVAGVLAELHAHPAAAVEPLPGELSDDAGMMLEPLGVAAHALRVGRVKAGRSAAVLGSGTIGLSCIMLLSRMGVSPIVATDVLDYRLEAARELGATHVLNPGRDAVSDAVRELTGGQGADYVLECAGEAGTARQMAEAAAIGGKLLVMGIPVEDRLAFRHSAARRKGLTIAMVRRCNVPLRELVALAVREELPLDRLVSHHFPLEEVQAAFETASEYADNALKVVVNP